MFPWRFTIVSLSMVACAESSDSSTGPENSEGEFTYTATQTSSSTSTSSTTSTTSTTALECSSEYASFDQGDCDLLQQDCNDGKTCKPYNKNGDWTTKCYSGAGLKSTGKTCDLDSECEAGLFCVDSLCSPVCCAETDEPCNGGLCNLNLLYDDGVYITVCSYGEQCELFEQDACDDELECHIEDPSQGLAVCSPPTSSQSEEGGPCDYINDCKDMQHCYLTTSGSSGVCRYYCHVDGWESESVGFGGCPSNEICESLDFGIDNVGLCLPE